MSDIINLQEEEAVSKIKAIALSARTCMMATSLSQLPLISRPMLTKDVDEDGNIWFFSKKSSNKNIEIIIDSRVQLFYTNHGDGECMTIFGEANVMYDREKNRQYWEIVDQKWYYGFNDPEISLVRVHPVEAYYWNTKTSRMMTMLKQLAGVFGAPITDDIVKGKMEVFG